MAKKGGLGKGLDALFSENGSSLESGAVMVPLSDLVPNKDQPRKEFSEEAIEDLSESIKKYGVLQPIIVIPLPDTTYKIVAGERRYRAAMKAGISEVPVIIKDFSEKEVSEVALIENLQREDLNPVEEALGYKHLQEKYSLTQDEIANSVGKSRSAVANSLRLLNLPDEALELLRDGKITGGHARALITLENEDVINAAAKRLADTGASVREAEKMVKKEKAGQTEKTKKPSPSFFKEMELALTESLGKKISVIGNSKKGKLVIEFYSKDELKELAEILSGEKIM
jgi:ParB family chromosome partitioning protein